MFHLCQHTLQVSLVFQSSTSRCLGHASHPEMIADLVEFQDQFRISDGVPHTHPGEPVGFGKGTHAEQALVTQIKRREGSRRGEFSIGFIQNEQAVFRNLFGDGLDAFRIPPASHRIVRVGNIDQSRLKLGCLLNQGIQVFTVIPVRNEFEFPAVTVDVVVEGRVGPCGSDNRIPRLQEHPGDITQHSVDALTDHDVSRLNLVMSRKIFPQIMKFRIPVHPTF